IASNGTPKLCAMRMRLRGTLSTLLNVAMTVGKKTPSAMTATFDGSPMPNHRMKSGSSAILGIGKSAETTGRQMPRASEKSPMARPTARPQLVPSAQPTAMRDSDAARWRASAPETTRARRANTMLHRLGRKTALSQPSSIAPCQRTTIARKARKGAARRGCGAKPPPRKATARESTAPLAAWRALSGIDDLAVGDHRLVADRLPELGAQPGELGLRRRAAALALRNVD